MAAMPMTRALRTIVESLSDDGLDRRRSSTGEGCGRERHRSTPARWRAVWNKVVLIALINITP